MFEKMNITQEGKSSIISAEKKDGEIFKFPVGTRDVEIKKLASNHGLIEVSLTYWVKNIDVVNMGFKEPDYTYVDPKSIQEDSK